MSEFLSLPDLPRLTLVLLCAAAMLAGFVDSVVGGGGLIQLPALLGLWTEVPLATVLGTNKLSSVWGTASAAWHYSQRLSISWRLALTGACTAFVGSYAGAKAVIALSGINLKPLIPIALIVVAWQVYRKPHVEESHPARAINLWAVSFWCFLIGFYDGFFGPGTGSFLIFLLVSYFGQPYLMASASAKFINLATNLAALIGFGVSGHIHWGLGLLLAVFNVIGAQLGARMAIYKGSAFVRRLFIAVVVALICKTGWDALKIYFLT